jgi:hypothetical protein
MRFVGSSEMLGLAQPRQLAPGDPRDVHALEMLRDGQLMHPSVRLARSARRDASC